MLEITFCIQPTLKHLPISRREKAFPQLRRKRRESRALDCLCIRRCPSWRDDGCKGRRRSLQAIRRRRGHFDDRLATPCIGLACERVLFRNCDESDGSHWPRMPLHQEMAILVRLELQRTAAKFASFQAAAGPRR